MRRAAVLAARGANLTAPNPRVGAVVLDRDGAPVGEGWHGADGAAHAEVIALAQAGSRARSGTVVVTLEPCNHHGRTPPCTHALLAAGISRVVYAVPDPNPTATGGAQFLAEYGIEVIPGVGAAEAYEANHEWLTAITNQRVHITYKAAMTVDGRVAARDGTSQWISSPAARHDGHRLRAQSDVIVAGRGTVEADGARLTARDDDGNLLPNQPLRVVVDSAGRTPSDAPVRDSSAPTMLATTTRYGPGPGGVDLLRLARGLFADGHRAALLEGGPTLAASFLAAGLVDRLVIYLAPLLLGAGRPLTADLGVATLADAGHWQLLDVTRIGPDLRLTYARTSDTIARPGAT